MAFGDGMEAALIQSPEYNALILLTPRPYQEADLAKELDINGDGSFLDQLPAFKSEKDV
jgi:hypothetical protein